MTDIEQQLRAYFDEIDPPFDVADLMREPRPELAPARGGVPSGFVVAVAAAVIVVLIVGFPLLLSGGQPEPAAEPTVTTALPVTTTLATAPVVETVPEHLTDLLSCLPLDPAGWSHSEPLSAMAASPRLPDLALTAAGGTAVAVGMDLDRNVEAYWSHDGIDWTRVEGFPEAKVVGESPPAVAGGDLGFVAVVVPDIYPGLAPLDHPDTPPIVAFSEDGIAWEVLDSETLPHGVLWLSDVYAGPIGFLITGTINTGDAGSGFGAFVWASSDGRTWSAADYPVESWSYPAVVATGTGWAAHTETGTRVKPSEVWRSTDGVNWYPTPVQNPPDVLAAEFRASPTAIDGDTWVIAKSFQQVRTPSLWTSADGGATWSQYPIGDDQPVGVPAGVFIRDIAATPLGMILTGRSDLGVDDAHLLAHSDDGADWQLCATPRLGPGAAADFTEIAMLGDTLIILDIETGIFHTWNDPYSGGGRS